MGVNASRLQATEVADWSPQDVFTYLNSLDGKEFETAASICIEKGIDGQMICQLAADSVMCSPYLVHIGLTSRESRHKLRHTLQMKVDKSRVPNGNASPVHSKELSTTSRNHMYFLNHSSLNGSADSPSHISDVLCGESMQTPSIVLGELKDDGKTDAEVHCILSALDVALGVEGLEGRRVWLEHGACRDICNTLQKYVNIPKIQVSGLIAIGKLCDGCEIARKELGKDCLACTLPYLAVASNPSLPEVATVACQVAALLVNDITPGFTIDTKTACLENVYRLMEGRMCETLGIVFELVSSLESAIKIGDLFPSVVCMLESACLCILYMSAIGGKVRLIMIKNEIIMEGVLIAMEEARKRELQQLALLSVKVIVNLFTNCEAYMALVHKRRFCVSVAHLMGSAFSNEDIVRSCCIALANICRCDPKSSLYIKEVHGYKSFSRALDKMKNSRKTVEALLLSISAILDTSMPGIQEKFGISKIGQLIVSIMLAHNDIDIIQQTGCRALMLLARRNVESQKCLGLGRACEAVAGAMTTFPEDQEIQEQGCGALLCLSENLMNAPNMCALGTVKILKKPLECLEKLTNFRTVELALEAIRNISCEGPDSARTVVNEGFLELILNLIRLVIHDPSMVETSSSSSSRKDLSVYQLAAHHGEEILQQACKVISEIASVPGVSMECCRLGGCETIVEALKWQDGRPTSILVECLKMVIYLTYDNPETKHCMASAGVCQSIIDAMKCSNVIQNQAAAADDNPSPKGYVCDPSVVVVLDEHNALERTCTAIDYLAAGKPVLQQMLHAAGVIPMLVEVLEANNNTVRPVVKSCALSAICSVCDGYPAACSSFFNANGLGIIMQDPVVQSDASMEDSMYFLYSALLRTSNENYGRITPMVVAGVQELGMLRGRGGIADDALTTLSAICSPSSESKLRIFVELGGLVQIAAALTKNPESAELAILATDTLTRFFETNIGGLWLESVRDPSETSAVGYNEQFFKLQIFAQALEQAINFIDADHTLNAMRLVKDFCERGGVLACRAFVSVQGHETLSTVLEPDFLEASKSECVRGVRCTCQNLTSIGNFVPPPTKMETVELFGMFLDIILVLCSCQEKLDFPDVNEADPDQEGEGPEASRKGAEDLLSVIVNSCCAEKVHEILKYSPTVKYIRILGRRILTIIMTTGICPQALECQEMWSGVAVSCLCSAVSFGDSEEVVLACKNLFICAKDGSGEHWRDTLLTSGLSDCLTMALVKHTYNLEAIRSLCMLTSAFSGSPLHPRYAQDFSTVGQVLCECMAYWSDKMNEYDQSVIGNAEWSGALDIVMAAATALSSLSMNFSANKLLVAGGAVEMVCDTITSKRMANRASLPSSLIICLMNLLSNLCAWPGGNERDYNSASLTSAAKLLSEWEQKIGEKCCDDGSDPNGPSLVSGGNEEERIAYCHLIQTTCTADPFFSKIMLQAGVPAAISAILHSCTIFPSPSVACEAFVAIRSMCHPKACNMGKEVMSTIWNSIVSALGTYMVNSSTVEEGLLAMNALVLKDTLDLELLWVDLQTMILHVLDNWSGVETLIEAALVLLANASERQRGERHIQVIPGLVRRLAMVATKFRFNDCIIEAVKEFLHC